MEELWAIVDFLEKPVEVSNTGKVRNIKTKNLLKDLLAQGLFIYQVAELMGLSYCTILKIKKNRATYQQQQ